MSLLTAGDEVIALSGVVGVQSWIYALF